MISSSIAHIQVFRNHLFYISLKSKNHLSVVKLFWLYVQQGQIV